VKVNLIEGLTGSGKTFNSIKKCASYFFSACSSECCIMAAYSFQALIDLLELFSSMTGVDYDELSNNLNNKVIVFNRHFPIKVNTFSNDVKVIFTTHACITRSGDSPLLNEFMTYVAYLSLSKNLHLIVDESLHFFNNLEWYFKLYTSGDVGENIPIYYSYKLNEYNVYVFSDIVLKEDTEYTFADFLYYIEGIKPDNIVCLGNSKYKTYTNKSIKYEYMFKLTKNDLINHFCIDSGFYLLKPSDCSVDKAMNFFFKESYQLVYLKKKFKKKKDISYICGMGIGILNLYISLFKSVDFVSSNYPV
jgi:hypothetical protein